LSKISTFPPLSLAYVAAATPSDWQIKILDENFDIFTFEEADLVGITAFTSNINRAYEIARIYRERGIKVVMGGIHVSMLPDEALKYADSVVIGEAEGIWGQVISDFENDHLAPKYEGQRIDLEKRNIRPRRDLQHPGYLWTSVQTSRGCPFSCSFCSVTKYLGKEYRQRSDQDVLEELKNIKGKYITFVDDNLIGYTSDSRERARRLFQGMVDLKLSKQWWMQTSLNAADDEGLIELAARAGCMFVFIGFETIDKATLKDMRKGVNLRIGVENYKKAVQTFHRHGIGVLGAFIIGNDYESDAYYKKLSDFLVNSGIDIFQVSILTPLPGTELMTQVQDAKRSIYQEFPQDWEKYRFSYVVHNPAGVEAETIYIGDNYLKNRLYSFPVYQYRMLRSLFNLRNLLNFHTVFKLNQSMRKSWRNSHYYKTYRKDLL
jgi:radical SAM superfamily enzyme YgiQ (UPF0313 family)